MFTHHWMREHTEDSSTNDLYKVSISLEVWLDVAINYMSRNAYWHGNNSQGVANGLRVSFKLYGTS